MEVPAHFTHGSIRHHENKTILKLCKTEKAKYPTVEPTEPPYPPTGQGGPAARGEALILPLDRWGVGLLAVLWCASVQPLGISV